MKIHLKHSPVRIDKNKMGGQILVTIKGEGTQIQSCIFSYGDKNIDYCETRREAEKAALEYMRGARAMFEMMKGQMVLNLTEFHELQNKMREG